MPQVFHRSFNTISRLTIFGAAFILAGQTVWLVVLYAAFRVIWRRGVRAYSAVGA